MKPRAILLDIEGTTTPIDFVHKTLFPFAKERIAAYVAANFDRIRDEVDQLKAEHAKETSYPAEFDETSPRSVSDYLRYLIDVDRKSTPLKSLQGKVWQEGYESGELLSEVFDDVPRAFERWKAAGKIIAIYSSGSVLAQQLLFRYTDLGDLTPYISNYFDTNVGGKREAESYRKIARELELKAETILFVSDIVSELDAARASAFQTALSIRKGNAPLTEEHSHKTIHSFDELD
jgi:enolase-phosphatase E1